MAKLACLLSLLLAVPCLALPPELRLEQAKAALEQDERHVQLWWWGWTGIFAGAGGVQTGLAVLVDDHDFRAQRQVGAVDGWLAVAGMALTPVKPGQRWVELPEATTEVQLKMAELELRERARKELQVGGWLDHTLCAAVAVGSAAYLWLHEKQPGGAAMIGITDLVIGELQLWTVPHTAVKAVRALDESR